jgi:hypothetical protein
MGTLAWGRAAGTADRSLGFTGNVALAGTRIVNAGSAPNDDVKLDWNVLPVDANTVALWRFNGDWNDAGAGGYTLTPANNAALLTDQLFNGAASFPADTDSASTTSVPSLCDTAMTLEGWVKVTSMPATSKALWYKQNAWSIFLHSGSRFCSDLYEGTSLHRRWVTLPYTLAGGWHHLAVTWNGTGRSQLLWVDGVNITNYDYNTSPGGQTTSDAYNVRLGAGTVGAHDEVRLSKVVRYSSTFSPHAYEAGSVACSDTAFGGGTVSRVDWSVDSGSGTVTAVYLWTSGGWQQVGGANPTSPLTGLAVTVPAGGSVVKVAMSPLAGGLQLVTPTLDWVQVTASSVGASRVSRPQRLGPYLLPMPGVML